MKEKLPFFYHVAFVVVTTMMTMNFVVVFFVACASFTACVCIKTHMHTYAQSIIRGTTKIPNNNEIVLTGRVRDIHPYTHTGATVLNRVESSENCEERKSRI